MRPPNEDCIVCGISVAQDAFKASWGPITIYYHSHCEDKYREQVAPRLRDASVQAIRRWISIRRLILSKEPNEPTNP